jgi:hypothetical protein
VEKLGLVLATGGDGPAEAAITFSLFGFGVESSVACEWFGGHFRNPGLRYETWGTLIYSLIRSGPPALFPYFRIQVFDLDTGSELYREEDVIGTGHRSAAISPGGDLLATFYGHVVVIRKLK